MDDELKTLLDEQSKLIKEIHAHTRALHRALLWGRVWSIAQFVVFVIVPLVLAYIYVVPAYQKYTKSLQDLYAGRLKPTQFMENLPPFFQSIMKFQGLDLETLQKKMPQNIQGKILKAK